MKSLGAIIGRTDRGFKNFRRLWKLRGRGEALHRLWKFFYSRQSIYRREKIDLFQFRKPGYPLSLPAGFSIELKKITNPEAHLFPAEIRVPPAIIQNRIRWGASIYGAFRSGRIIDFCWAVTGHPFYEVSEGLVFRLKADESYFFDYRGIRKGRPLALSRFVLMKALILYMLTEEEKRAGRPLRFYSIVDIDNHPSRAFHSRYLRARKIARLRLDLIFGRRFWMIPADIKSLLRPRRRLPDEKIESIKNNL